MKYGTFVTLQVRTYLKEFCGFKFLWPLKEYLKFQKKDFYFQENILVLRSVTCPFYLREKQLYSNIFFLEKQSYYNLFQILKKKPKY